MSLVERPIILPVMPSIIPSLTTRTATRGIRLIPMQIIAPIRLLWAFDFASNLEDFGKILAKFDNVVIATIYAAREKNIYNVKEEDLVNLIKENGNENAIYIDSFDKIKEYIKENAKDGDLVITIGAGDVYKIGKLLVK